MRLKTKHLNTEFIQTHLRGTFQGHLLIAKSLYIYCTYSLTTTRETKNIFGTDRIKTHLKKYVALFPLMSTNCFEINT